MPHSRLVYYIRGDKEFQGEPERVYGANWAKTGSKWASNPHIREGRGQIDQKSANTVGYDPEDGVQRAPNLRILLLLPRIDFPVCLYFFCNMPSDCEVQRFRPLGHGVQILLIGIPMIYILRKRWIRVCSL